MTPTSCPRCGAPEIAGEEGQIVVCPACGHAFEGDPPKAARNLADHQVSFEEARTVFDDPLALQVYDHKHSETEDRYIYFGMSNQGRMLAVIFTTRENAIRIISAREMTPREKRIYESENYDPAG
ncbi:MAG: BrnT family toxin [Blastocatellia bacterium]